MIGFSGRRPLSADLLLLHRDVKIGLPGILRFALIPCISWQMIYGLTMHGYLGRVGGLLARGHPGDPGLASSWNNHSQTQGPQRDAISRSVAVLVCRPITFT